jgi:hypothetical protein
MLLICLLDCLPTAVPYNRQEFRTSYINCDENNNDYGSKNYYSCNMKGKFHSRTCHKIPVWGKNYSCTLSLTSVLDEGGWLTPRPVHVITGNDLVPIVK